MKLELPKSSTPLIALGLAIVVAFVLLVYIPLNRGIAAAKASLALKQSMVSQEASLLAQIEQQHAEMDDVEAYTSRWTEVPNANLYLSQMLGQISQQAKLAGTQSLRLEPGQMNAMQAVERIPVRLGCRGTFQQIHQLLCQMEQLPHEIWLQRIELAPADDHRRELNCEMEFEAFIVSVKNSH